MKTIWKVLGIAALAAAIPVRVKKDEEKGRKTYQSLLYTVDVGPGEGGEGTDIAVNFDGGILTGAITGLAAARKEAELFADDEPEAAVLDGSELQVAVDTEDLQVTVDVAQEAADEAQDAADEAQAGADEAAEADFDPEF